MRPEDVFINLVEVLPENWSFGNGIAQYAPTKLRPSIRPSRNSPHDHRPLCPSAAGRLRHQIIRSRAGARGHLFDAIPELYFKAFLLRERGRFGAIASEYSSLYLWRADQGFRDFLVDGRTRSVTDSFGRPQVETRFVLDALKGEGRASALPL